MRAGMAMDLLCDGNTKQRTSGWIVRTLGAVALGLFIDRGQATGREGHQAVSVTEA
jgi:hypothetical protein